MFNLITHHLHTMDFSPEVLARVAPDVSLQRHLAHGLRPLMRNYTEFQAAEYSSGHLNQLGENSVVGSCIAKKASTTLFCGVTLGVVETPDAQPEYASVFPVVEIARGRSGAPTDEEMMLSQRLHDTLLHGKVVPSKALAIETGFQVVDGGNSSILYPGASAEVDEVLAELPALNNRKKYSFVLYIHVKVFSRTGPLFDVCYNAVASALADVKLPRVYVGDTSDQIKVPVRSRGNFGHISGGDNLFIDTNASLRYPLDPEDAGVSSSFGVIDVELSAEDDVEEQKTVLLADLEGDAEETCATSRISVVSHEDGTLLSLSVCGGGANVSVDVLRESLKYARMRAKK